MTKCDFAKYGSSGTIERQDALCVLPQNIVNEKIFVILWIWLIALAVTSVVCFAFTVSDLFMASRKIKFIQVSSKCWLMGLQGIEERYFKLDCSDFAVQHACDFYLMTGDCEVLRLIPCLESYFCDLSLQGSIS